MLFERPPVVERARLLLMERIIPRGEGGWDAKPGHLNRMQQQRSVEVLDAPLEDIYDVTEVDIPAPPPARIMVSVECAACGEPTMETRIRRLEGRDLCLPCFEQEMSGSVRLASPTLGRRDPR
ncbi:MAG: TraR/DksA C4-type zinc finger protein [Actinomycetota bacterium]|nr:TraR/DksA C4-type zinc finger protein [Actinomycetota bacterium]